MPMTLEQAAKNLDKRHKLVTGESQHIEKKTLDDYYGYIRMGSETKTLYDFKKNEQNLIKDLRTHCLDAKRMH